MQTQVGTASSFLEEIAGDFLSGDCIVSKSSRILLHINKLVTCNVHSYLCSCIDSDSLF